MSAQIHCLVCPGRLLRPVEGEPDTFFCEECRGVLLPAAKVPDELRPPSATPDSGAAEITESAEKGRESGTGEMETDEVISLVCPVCGEPMFSPALDRAAFLCSGCGGAWIGPAASEAESASAEVTEEEAARQTARRFSRYLMYSLTLPERVVRSAVGLTAGATREVAEFVIPQAFQNSKTYEVVIRNSLKFLAEDIGGVEPSGDEEELEKDFIARKAVGNFIDLAGWATLAVSPVWLMAIISDVAYGTERYVHELAAELHRKGLIDEHSSIHNIDDVLQALKDASGTTASLVDTPPLSIDQLRDSLDSTREALARVDVRKVFPEPELHRYWQEMREVAEREKVGLIGVSGALTLHTLSKIGAVGQGVFTGTLVMGQLINQHIVGHYRNALNDVRHNGFYHTLRETAEPYIEAVWNNFAVEQTTWTAELLSGRAIGKAFSALRGWLSPPRRSRPPAEAESPAGEE